MTSLHQIAFSDLFISADAQEPTRYRVAPGTPAQMLPATAEADIEEVRAACLVDQRNEFLLVWAGLPLRVTRIDHVEGTAWAVSRGASRASTLAELNVQPLLAKAMVEVGKTRGGLVATVGSSRQGKTTTSAAMFVEWHTHFGGTGLTVEQPPEIPMNGSHGRNGFIYQCEVLPTASEAEREAEIGKHLRRALRSGVDRIFMGETRSPSEAAVALDAATSNHLVLLNFHAEGIDGGIGKLAELAGRLRSDAWGLVAESLVAIFYQQMTVQEKDGQLRPIPVISPFIIPGGVDGRRIRGCIREGKLAELSTDIDRQRGMIRSRS